MDVPGQRAAAEATLAPCCNTNFGRPRNSQRERGLFVVSRSSSLARQSGDSLRPGPRAGAAQGQESSKRFTGRALFWTVRVRQSKAEPPLPTAMVCSRCVVAASTRVTATVPFQTASVLPRALRLRTLRIHLQTIPWEGNSPGPEIAASVLTKLLQGPPLFACRSVGL